MKAEELRKAEKYQTLKVLQHGALEGITRSHYCFALFPDDEVVNICDRSCPKSPKCAECTSDDIEHSVKNNTYANSDIRRKWPKCLLLKKGVKDPRPTSTEAAGQRKWVGFVIILIVFFLEKR